MKTNIFTIVLFVVLFVATATAQEPQSFRSLSLGGIIFDDLDLVYDPIELQFVDSLRLYTNLSNTSLRAFTSSETGSSASNEYLLGVSRKNPIVQNLWTALLLRFEKSKVPNFLSINSDLNGNSYTYGQGELQSEYTEYLDQDNNDLYDLKRAISQKQSSLSDYDAYSFVFNNSYDLKDYTIGLKFTLGNYFNEGNQAMGSYGTGQGLLQGSSWGSPTFNRSVDEFYTDSGYSRLKWGERGDYSNTYESPFLRLGVSAMRVFGEYEVRADMRFNTIENTNTVHDKYQGDETYFNPRNVVYVNSFTENETYNYTQGESGNAFGFGGSVRYNFDEEHERRNSGYVHFGVNAAFESFDFTNSNLSNSSSTDILNDGTSGAQNDTKQVSTMMTAINDNGTGTRNRYSVDIRTNKPLSDGVYLGIGASYSLSSLKRETNYSDELKTTFDYTTLDNVTDWYDYLRTTTSKITANRTYKVSSSFLTLPVAVEYQFSEDLKWKLRIGSVFQYISSTTDDAKQITDSQPYTEKTNRGDGTINLSIQDNKYSSRSEHRVNAETRTYLTYGIGFDPTSNFQIDAMGFFNIQEGTDFDEYLQNFKLAVVFKL
ncbi:MAG: hypothetical protein HYZ34_00610 [Ignavibacteriae bacterium]|nr:hypothetical protein [Ignavibacteriota bacterium]